MTRAESVVDALAGVEAGPPLDGAAGRLLAALEPAESAAVISRLLGRPDPDARESKALFALCRALHFGAPALDEGQRQAIHRAARSLGFGEVTALFTAAAPRRVADEVEASRPAEEDLAASLGHRTQSARAERRPERLLRLCLDPHPAVIRNLLLNPRVTEAHVLRVAARRPIDEAVLEEVGLSPRWSARPAVRRSIVFNPWAAPALAVSLLPGFGRAELEEVAASGTLHPAVRDAARALLVARGGAG